MNTCAFKSSVQNFGYRLIVGSYINYPFYIYCFFVVDKQIVGL